MINEITDASHISLVREMCDASVISLITNGFRKMSFSLLSKRTVSYSQEITYVHHAAGFDNIYGNFATYCMMFMYVVYICYVSACDTYAK